MGRTYAISDVHGMGHLLDQMLEKIAFSEADRLYILGDLIDRGTRPGMRAGSGDGTEKYHCIKGES